MIEPGKIFIHDWVDSIINDNTSNKICITAGYGTSKTYGSWQWLLSGMERNPACKTFFYSEPTYGQVRRIAVEKFVEVADSYQLSPSFDYRIVLGENPKIIIPSRKQEILLLSMDRPSTLVGFEAGRGVVDEAGLTKEDSRRKISARLRSKGMRQKHQLLEVTTPEGLNHVADDYNSDEQSGWTFTKEYDAFKKEIITTNEGEFEHIKRRIRLSTYLNKKFLPYDYISKLYSDWGHNQNYIDSYVFGYFRPFATGLAYAAFKAALHKIKPIKARADLPLNLCFDFNICPVFTVIQEQRDRFVDDNNYVQEERYDAIIDNANHGHELLEDVICQEFVEKFPRTYFRNTPIHIYGDPTGYAGSHKATADFSRIKKWLNELGYANVTIMAPRDAPLERVSVDCVNRAFSENLLKVCENCDMVLKSLIRTCWSRGERKKLDKPKNDTWTHPMDSVKYYVSAKLNKRVMA